MVNYSLTTALCQCPGSQLHEGQVSISSLSCHDQAAGQATLCESSCVDVVKTYSVGLFLVAKYSSHQLPFLFWVRCPTSNQVQGPIRAMRMRTTYCHAAWHVCNPSYLSGDSNSSVGRNGKNSLSQALVVLQRVVDMHGDAHVEETIDGINRHLE